MKMKMLLVGSLITVFIADNVTVAEEKGLYQLDKLAKYILIGEVTSLDSDVKTIQIAGFLKGEEILGRWQRFKVVEGECPEKGCLKRGDEGVFFIKSADEGFVSFVREKPYALF